jgi:hypothetical protein
MKARIDMFWLNANLDIFITKLFINTTIQKALCKDKLARFGKKEFEPTKFFDKGPVSCFLLQVVGPPSKGQDPSALAQEQQNKLTSNRLASLTIIISEY